MANIKLINYYRFYYSYIIVVMWLFFSTGSTTASDYDILELKCLVCKQTINEIVHQVSKIDPTINVPVSGYRLGVNGELEQKLVPQAKSEVYLSELFETTCAKMNDYVRATWKSNGTLMLLKLVGSDGKMNPDMSNVDIIQDDDLNKSLQYYCTGILEEFVEDIIKYVQQVDEISIGTHQVASNVETMANHICTDVAQLCENNDSSEKIEL